MEWTSQNYRNGSFQNLSPTELMAKEKSFLSILRDFLNKPKTVTPPRPLPAVKTDLKAPPPAGTRLIWFGHSSYLLQSHGLNILVDPVFSGYASPFSFLIKAFAGTNTYTAADMPEIDILIITHNHYDHLDAGTLRKLHQKIKAVYTPLGVSKDLVRCGIPASLITEMDWWEEKTIHSGFTLTAAPARHFSGRGFKRGGSLWASFVLQTPESRIYIGGDSGYDTHFKTIGEKFGPFDIAILETGQYNTSWPLIHMSPEEAVKAAGDLRAKVMLPVHWGKFALANHPWDEPVVRVLAASNGGDLQVATPRIGEPVILGQLCPQSHWWEDTFGSPA